LSRRGESDILSADSKGGGDLIMKKSTKILIVAAAVIGFFAALCAVWACVHRRVIRSAIRKEPFPACPHWLPGCILEKIANTEPAGE